MIPEVLESTLHKSLNQRRKLLLICSPRVRDTNCARTFRVSQRGCLPDQKKEPYKHLSAPTSFWSPSSAVVTSTCMKTTDRLLGIGCSNLHLQYVRSGWVSGYKIHYIHRYVVKVHRHTRNALVLKFTAKYILQLGEDIWKITLNVCVWFEEKLCIKAGAGVSGSFNVNWC